MIYLYLYSRTTLGINAANFLFANYEVLSQAQLSLCLYGILLIHEIPTLSGEFLPLWLS
jgi:hypothetical protein